MTPEQLEAIIKAQTQAIEERLIRADYAAQELYDLPQSAEISPAFGYTQTAGTAASVPALNAPQTIIGALMQNTAQRSEASPIEIRTTVELDGDVIGEAVALYNDSRSRITNGAAQ